MEGESSPEPFPQWQDLSKSIDHSIDLFMFNSSSTLIQTKVRFTIFIRNIVGTMDQNLDV